MKCVILAGGLGTRLSEETLLKPKPMVEIGGRPILWHIMKIYSSFGVNDFIVCCGYKGYIIKEYFANYALHMSDVTFDMSNNQTLVHQTLVEPWKVTLVDTGEESNTGGRLKAVSAYLKDDDAFCFTYGDGVANVDVGALIKFHRAHGKAATVTAVQPAGRYGVLRIEEDSVREFVEKPAGDGGWINGGFFVLSQKVFGYLRDSQTSWESKALYHLAADDELQAFRHPGFWLPMDTLRDRNTLDQLWATGKAPWKVW